MVAIRRISHNYPGMIRDYLRVLLFDNRRTNYIETFEKKLADFLNVPETVCTSYGCHALSIALDFYGIDKTKKVLLPTYTAKVVERVLIEKGIPYRAVDIDPSTANMSLTNLQQTPLCEFSAIIITHLFGVVVQKDTIEYCRKLGLIVIEDCAHAQGAKFMDGTSVGTFGDAGFYSFGYSKIINTYTGGLLVTKNSQLIKYARSEIAIRQKPSILTLLQRIVPANIERLFIACSWMPLSKYFLYNERILRAAKTFLNLIISPKVTQFYKYTNAQAYIGLIQLSELLITLENRKNKSQLYESKLPEIKFLNRNPGDVYYNQIAILKKASKFRRKLISVGIDSGTDLSVMEKIGHRFQGAGVDLALASYLQLPLFQNIEVEIIDETCRTIQDFQKKINSD